MCHYTNINRVSDIMVGDFWGCPETIDDNKGLNLISVNQHGEKLLQKINASEKNIVLKEFPQNKVLQPQLCFPTAKHYARSRFFEELKKQDFNELVNSIFDKNKNVALLNFHWENNNYGAVLTAYALNKYINSLGYYAYNVDFIPTWGKSSVSTSNFKEFKEKHLPCTKHCNNLSDLKTLNDDFGTFIVGSDQVFNPEFVNTDKQIYYLGFVNDLNKKVSYSASFGQKEFKASEKDIIEVGYLLSRFNQIGVREESGVDICKNTFRIKAFHVLDPVF